MNLAISPPHSVLKQSARRILFIAGNYPPHIVGGGEISTRIMAEAFAAIGAAVHVVTCGEREAIRVENGVTIESIESPNVYWRLAPALRSKFKRVAWHALDNYNPRALRVLTETIEKIRPDIVVTSILENFGASAWLAAKNLDVPVVNIVHGYYLQCIAASRFRNSRHCEQRCMRCRLGTAGKKYFSKYVDGVIGVSRYILDAYREEGYFPNARSICIYNPVEDRADEPRIKPMSQSLTFGYLGKMHPIKGIEELIRAFSSGDIKARLIVAGDGSRDYESRLRAQADRRIIDFIGWVDPGTLFGKIDFLIYPSVLNEPFGRGIIEAMSQGIPVIGARRGGIPEVIEHGRNGFLYDPAVPGELDRVIELARAADYAELSRQALMTSKPFSKSIILRQCVDFLNTIAEERKFASDLVTATP